MGERDDVGESRRPPGPEPDHRPVLGWLQVATEAAEKALTEQTAPLGEEELAAAMRLLTRLGNAGDRCQLKVVREARDRGAGVEHGWTPVDWVIEATGRQLSPPRAAALVRVAAAATRPGMGCFLEAVECGALPFAKADQIARFERDVRLLAPGEDVLNDVAALVRIASDDADGRGLSERELARAISYAGQFLKPDAQLVKEEAARRLGRALYRGPVLAGMSTYRLILDPEGAAVVDAAVAALSAPVRGADGSPDPRSAAARRADALLDVIRRGVSAPGSAPKSDTAQVMVTIGYDQLAERLRGAGFTMTGQVLSPTTVRKIACDAGILPTVLGAHGELLDIGRGDRFFTGALRRAMWHRDKECTWPGCTIPAQWCAAHHVTWWVRGGATSLANGALLCDRHHTIVHQRDLTATVTDTCVTWHL